ncbi:indolethylamine N-methyltransferase-like isoform X1 [Aquarana catesbeiana]|uniref:indolethylamine N-methyltransferase-like isoform X1 n=1 Tax=Aquarana catesbeiana TaxID=8400 RepID=UPI003CCA5228
MDSTTHKFYHVHGMDSRSYLDLYFSNNEDMVFAEDTLKFPMSMIHYQLCTGRTEGTFLIDISLGSIIHHLYFVSKFFKKIVLLKFQEKCIMELNRWLHDRTGAYDWSHTSSAAAELEGMSCGDWRWSGRGAVTSNREGMYVGWIFVGLGDQLQEQEMRLRSSIKQILKCDYEQENVTSPVLLPLADCVIGASILEMISKNEDEYMKNLEKTIKLLKPGGQLLLFAVLDATYWFVGAERFHCFKCNEEFVKNAFGKLGLVIDYYTVKRRCNVSDLADYKAILFIVGRKGE